MPRCQRRREPPPPVGDTADGAVCVCLLRSQPRDVSFFRCLESESALPNLTRDGHCLANWPQAPKFASVLAFRNVCRMGAVSQCCDGFF